MLSDLSLQVQAGEMLALMGPMGSGKSSLLRVLAGIAQQNASAKLWGDLRYQGQALGQGPYPALVSQNARMLTASVQENLASHLPNRGQLTWHEQRDRIVHHLECSGLGRLRGHLQMPAVELDLCEQRLLAIARQSIAAPALLCVDEPTAGLDDSGAERVMAALHAQQPQSAILIALHQQDLAKSHAQRVALLAGGRIQEIADARQFFESPASVAARAFVGTGTCLVASPDADPASLDDDTPRPPALPPFVREAVSAWAGPRGFVWLERGRLAGTPQPGVFDDLDRDLDALARVGVTKLLTLLERPLSCEQALRARGIEATWEPIADMDAPEFLQCLRICQLLDHWLTERQIVAVHCRAGHGRTGTVLAAYRIWRGQTAIDAIDGVRQLEPKWIQSAAQVRFLNDFAHWAQQLPSSAHADRHVYLPHAAGVGPNP
ncbi:ATP-binding cassette domain-containing protein [Ahniella affigens]|uniref:phosphatase domain-containing putative toxin n=1 Tax=Ahniella affigens TaxID=2021234 RepID=UPI0011B1CC21|nr:ATP-binding cassette domain-containing protein [Ahniella affigens]